MMMTKPVKFKWRWNLSLALGVWILSAIGYGVVSAICRRGDFVCRQDFTFAHTFLGPAILLAVLAPLSLFGLGRSKWLIPVLALWEGVMIPGVYLVGRSLTGLGNHCDKVAIFGGGIAFSVILLCWGIVVLGRRQLNRSIQLVSV